MSPATSTAAVRAGSTSSTLRARSSVASSTDSPQPPISASVATTGRRCSSRAACISVRSTSKSPASRCRWQRRRERRVGKGALLRAVPTGLGRGGHASLCPPYVHCSICIGGDLMTIHLNISRRQMLAMSAAAGGLAVGGIGRASAQQPVKRIDQFDPALEKIIATAEPINYIAEGMGGPLGPVEGPVWWKEGGYLLFSDIHASKRMKYTPGQGVTVFQEKTNGANGLTRDLQGRLLACEHETRRVTRQELDGSLTVIASSFQGRRFNRPNDVVVKSDGAIYFTDPGGPAVPEQWDLNHTGVYRVSADLGALTLLVNDFVVPNGLAFSPDESILYIT